ncbi:MAG: glutaredoxin family protein [Gemmataceae bacterium]|nr:glutaredoxin family protein [Gemmataceae bacterium]
MLGWLFGARAREVVLYTRQGCHLCHDALALLERERPAFGFALSVVDVDSDPALAERHGLEVPVVLVDGKPRLRGTVNAVLLRRALRGSPG